MADNTIRSYRDLKIWKLARELVVSVHKMTKMILMSNS